MLRNYNKIILSYLLIIISLTIIFSAAPLVLAAPEDSGYHIITSIPGTTIESGKAVKNNITLQGYIGQIYIFALGIVGLVAVAAMVYWSFTYILAAGNASKMSDAVNGIQDAILGLALLLLAALILGFINPKLTTLSPLDSLDPIPKQHVGPPKPVWVQTAYRGGQYGECGEEGLINANFRPVDPSKCEDENPSNPPNTIFKCCEPVITEAAP